MGLTEYSSLPSTLCGRAATVIVFWRKRSAARELSGPTAIVTAPVASVSNSAVARPELTLTTVDTILSPTCAATRNDCLPRSSAGIADASMGIRIVLILHPLSVELRLVDKRRGETTPRDLVNALPSARERMPAMGHPNRVPRGARLSLKIDKSHR